MDLTRADRLRAFLERFEDQPVVWGRDDCSACPSLWLGEETCLQVDYPAYRTKEDALALKARRGGLLPIWSERLAEVGVSERFGEPELGDIGIIDTRRWGEIGGIIAASRIIILRKDTGGWHALGPVRQFVKVWALPA